MKLARPHQRLVEMMGWPEDFSESTIKLIGLAEMLGALGLVLSGVVDITTILTP
jgi:hypothetical protein